MILSRVTNIFYHLLYGLCFVLFKKKIIFLKDLIDLMDRKCAALHMSWFSSYKTFDNVSLMFKFNFCSILLFQLNTIFNENYFGTFGKIIYAAVQYVLFYTLNLHMSDKLFNSWLTMNWILSLSSSQSSSVVISIIVIAIIIVDLICDPLLGYCIVSKLLQSSKAASFTGYNKLHLLVTVCSSSLTIG